MLRSITWEEFKRWRLYETLEPFAMERADYNAAHIVHALWNIARDRQSCPEGWPLLKFVLPFGDAPVHAEEQGQTVEQQERLIDAWISGSNAIIAAKRGTA